MPIENQDSGPLLGTSKAASPGEARGLVRLFWIILGLIALGAAIAGAVLPLVPTTPFLLVAAYSFARSHKPLHDWLLAHRYFGPLIRDWHAHGAIARRTKLSCVAVMIATIALSILLGASMTVIAVQAVVLTCAAAFVLSRPEGPRP